MRDQIQKMRSRLIYGMMVLMGVFLTFFSYKFLEIALDLTYNFTTAILAGIEILIFDLILAVVFYLMTEAMLGFFDDIWKKE